MINNDGKDKVEILTNEHRSVFSLITCQFKHETAVGFTILWCSELKQIYFIM